jgi:hypothetical protein
MGKGISARGRLDIREGEESVRRRKSVSGMGKGKSARGRLEIREGEESVRRRENQLG